MTPRNEDARAQGDDKGSKAGGRGAAHRECRCSSRRVPVQLTESVGAAHGECRCSSLRVRGWWMLTIKSHGVEISITGGVEEMVRDPNPLPFFLSPSFFFLFLFHLQFVSSSRYKKCMQR